MKRPSPSRSRRRRSPTGWSSSSASRTPSRWSRSTSRTPSARGSRGPGARGSRTSSSTSCSWARDAPRRRCSTHGWRRRAARTTRGPARTAPTTTTSAPPGALPLLLWLEADRLRDSAGAMTQEKLDLQRDVVRNERRQNIENRPYGKAELALPELLYPEGHPYHHPVIGSPADLAGGDRRRREGVLRPLVRAQQRVARRRGRLRRGPREGGDRAMVRHHPDARQAGRPRRAAPRFPRGQDDAHGRGPRDPLRRRGAGQGDARLAVAAPLRAGRRGDGPPGERPLERQGEPPATARSSTTRRSRRRSRRCSSRSSSGRPSS